MARFGIFLMLLAFTLSFVVALTGPVISEADTSVAFPFPFQAERSLSSFSRYRPERRRKHKYSTSRKKNPEKDSGDHHEDKCFRDIQSCVILNWFAEGDECPESTEYCPTLKPEKDGTVTCARVGEHCRDSFDCDRFGRCCGNCINVVTRCCPELCTSCLTVEQRCDAFKVAKDSTECGGNFLVLKKNVCFERGIFPCTEAGATLYCKSFVGTENEECFDNCMAVVNDNQCCDCL